MHVLALSLSVITNQYFVQLIKNNCVVFQMFVVFFFLLFTFAMETNYQYLPCSMGDIHNIIFFRFCDVTKQNGHVSVGTLFREPLGEIEVHHNNVYKIKKGYR